MISWMQEWPVEVCHCLPCRILSNREGSGLPSLCLGLLYSLADWLLVLDFASRFELLRKLLLHRRWAPLPPPLTQRP